MSHRRIPFAPLRRARVPVVAALAALAAACAPDLDTTRASVERGSFGETVFQEVCQRVAYTSQLDEKAEGARQSIDVSASVYGPVCIEGTTPPGDAPRRLLALLGEKIDLVRAVDLAMPDDFLEPLEEFLLAIRPLHDDGTMESTLSAIARLLERLIADEGFTTAMGRVSGRDGFRPPRAASGLGWAVLSFAGIDSLLDDGLDILLDAAGQPTAELRSLLTTLAAELRGAEALADPTAKDRTLRIALDLLFSPSADAAPPGAAARLLALRDGRGLPAPATSGNGTPVPPPFADVNRDQLADADEHGRLVDAAGAPLPTPFLVPGAADPNGAKRDPEGRLLGGDGKPAYAYKDLEGTLLAALLREGATVADPQRDNLAGLVHGASALLGPRVEKTKAYKDGTKLKYRGFDVAGSSLIDLAHAFVQVLGTPRARDLLLSTRTLLDKYEPQAARAVAGMLDVNDRGKRDARAQIPEGSVLYDRVIELVVRILVVPGLIEALMDAMTDPHLRGFGPMLAQQLRFKDRFVLDQKWKDTVSGSYKTPVNRAAPDAGWNRSVLQRMLHLVHDANGVQFCNKQGASVRILGVPLLNYDRCKMFKIDDLGLFFALTIADRAIVDNPARPETRNAASFREQVVDGTMKTLIADSPTGDSLLLALIDIPGFGRFPTPAAAARTLFLTPDNQSDFMRNSSDPVTCSAGDRFIDAHPDSMFAWEAKLASNPSGFANDDFYAAVRPLINAFARHDECVPWYEYKACKKKRNAVKLFLDLLSILHEHWGSAASGYDRAGQLVALQSADPKAPHFHTGDGAVTYESVMAEAFSDSDLVPAVLDLAPTLNTMTLDGTMGAPRARPVLIDALRYVFDPALTPMSLSFRDGRTATKWNDGKTEVPRATPYHLLADAYARRRLQLASASADRAGSWRGATSALVDQVLTVERDKDGKHRLKNRRMRGVTLALIDFLRARLDAHASAGDLDAWIRKNLSADIESAAAGPVMAALADLIQRAEESPGLIRALNGLVQHLADEGPGGAFPLALTALGDVLQALLDDRNLVPLGRGLGQVVDPGSLAEPLRMVRLGRKLDPNPPTEGRNATLVRLFANLLKPPPGNVPAAPAVADIGDALAEVNRVRPGSGGPLDGTDYATMMEQVRLFLLDEQRGFMKFVRIVQNRRFPAPAAK